jgi:Flp pilus assembly protein TadD
MLDRALTAAYTATFLAPASPEARNTLGTVLWRLGRRADAARAFEAAVGLSPDASYAWSNLCQAALAVGDTKNATSYCQRAARLQRRARRSAQ